MIVKNCTNRNEKLFDFFQSMSHPGIRFRWRSKNFDENVEVIVQVEVLGFSTFPQLFFLQKEKPWLRGCHCTKKKKKEINATQSPSTTMPP